jgi:carboxyl-terminal processing protease
MGVIVLKNRSFLLISILTVGLFLLIGGKDYSSVVAKEQESDTLIYEQLDLFGKVFERIRDEYIEEVSTKDLVEAAINGMLTSLDPHSSYLAPDDFEDMRTQTKGEFGGLGIEVTQDEGYIKVITPMDDTPAFDAGIEAGDFITSVDGKSLLGLTLNEAVDLMRGPVGSEIIITVVREGFDDPFDVSIIRDIIKITAVKSRRVGDSIVLRISAFNKQTYPNLKNGLSKEITAAGGLRNVNGIVLDLRNNPGGLLSEAISVSDAFLDKGEIVSTRGRNLNDSQRYNARRGDLSKGKPIVVLINNGSASASEIVAGALQDHKRAVIVGQKSFGKGSVQTIIPVQGDGAMRLTTSRYYTPSGRSIQALGVSPDIIVKQPSRKSNEKTDSDKTKRTVRSEADLRGSLNNDSISSDERNLLREEEKKAEDAAKLRNEDYQLAYALDILKGLSALSYGKK